MSCLKQNNEKKGKTNIASFLARYSFIITPEVRDRCEDVFLVQGGRDGLELGPLHAVVEVEPLCFNMVYRDMMVQACLLSNSIQKIPKAKMNNGIGSQFLSLN